jgi:glycosyltransferase involved in cell wall biosynthesis
MHIALVTTSYPDAGGGSEAAGAFVADFAQALARHARVTVVAAARSTSRAAEGDVAVERFAVPRVPLSLLRPLNPADWSSILTTLRSGHSALENLVATDRPDFIFALWALPCGHWAQSMQKKYGVPYGTWALGSDIWSLGRIPVIRGILGRVIAAAGLSYADGLMLAGDVQRLSGRDCEFLPSARRIASAVPEGIAGGPPYKLAFLGRWHPNKGIDLLLDALQRLTDDDWSRISDVRIHGGGPLEQLVHDAVAKLQSQKRPVVARGYLDSAAAADFITWADYLLLPSRIESIPVIFSDAAQLRRPLVAAPVGDLPELFRRHEFGILASAPGVDAYADALRRALRADASAFDAQLASIAGEFDVDATAERFALSVARLTA